MRPFLLALVALACVAPAAAHAQWGTSWWGTPGWAVTSPGYHAARHHHRHKLQHKGAHRHHAAAVGVARKATQRHWIGRHGPQMVAGKPYAEPPLRRPRPEIANGQATLEAAKAVSMERKPAGRAPNGTPLVRVPTAAGISITVAADSFADRIVAFISDVVTLFGYRPPRINCYAPHGHVPNSRHHDGHGCDVNQCGWNCTDPPMRHVAALAKAHGLRDGCSFRSRKDCGHIDDGGNVRIVSTFTSR